MRRRYIYAFVTFIVFMTIIGGLCADVLWESTITLRVFCAGSLALPLERIKERFERDFSSYRPRGSLRTYRVRVQLEPAGSVQCIRKIIDIGKRADVLAIADYSLIPEMMMNYTDWYLRFAKNKIVIAFTDKSRYADEINSRSWFQILRRSNVRWGFSNPNMDPCGYRSLWVIQLAELEYGDSRIFEDLVEKNSAIRMNEEAGIYTCVVPENLKPNPNRLVIRDKSVELVVLLESGGLDYAFEYLSVAVQYGLRYVELPESIDLSGKEHADVEKYSRMRALLRGGNLTATPIHYGVTVPRNAAHPELAAAFIKYMIDEEGRRIFKEMGQPPIHPALASNFDKIPEILRPYCTGEGMNND